MKKTIESRILGSVEVDEKDVIVFDTGIFGFEDAHEFFLFEYDTDGIFRVLQNGEDGDLCFVVMEPQLVFADYKPDVHEEDYEAVKPENEDDIVMLVIITIPENMQEMTANLQGPLYINSKTRKGRQCITKGDEYTTRHRVLTDEAAAAEEK